MLKKIKSYFYEINLLIKSVPTLLFAFFVAALFCMNLLANKSIQLPFDWLALDCGILISWFIFLTMNICTKHFGPKAATELSFVATFINLLLCFILFIVSIIPGQWNSSFVAGHQSVINSAINKTFGGTWYVIFGSTVAFLVSAIVNNFSNHAVGVLFKGTKSGYFEFIVRAYISTALGQFTDNLVFSLIVSKIFFGWTLLQCVTSALTGMLVEIIIEMLFLKFGYKIVQNWNKNKVGLEYFTYREKK